MILGIGSTLAIVFGFILAALIDREKRGEGFFRTVFLYPLAVSLIVTGVAWRWIFNPNYGLQAFLHCDRAHLDQLRLADQRRYRDVRDHPRLLSGRASGFYMALMLSGLKSINTEIWSAAKLDGVSVWRLYIEIIIPMMKFTFLTCAILLSLGVVKAYDVVVAMTNGGPGQATWVPAYFTINAYWVKSNLGFASAAAVIMLLITGRDLPAAGAAHRVARAGRGRRGSNDDDRRTRAGRRDQRSRRRSGAALSAAQEGHHGPLDRDHRASSRSARRSSACRST